jgi:CheY-like chemotaxis protein
VISRSLLVVEDDTDLREYFHVAFLRAGHKVSVAADGLAALRRIDAGFLPDVVILDLHLPVLSGQEVLAELAANSQTRSIPVIIVTGGLVRPSRANVHRTLLKPVTAEQVLVTVEECLAS